MSSTKRRATEQSEMVIVRGNFRRGLRTFLAVVADSGGMESREELVNRIDTLERRQEQLTEVVQELADLAPTNMDGTPMALVDARTWQDPEIKIHIFESVGELIHESPDRYVGRKEVKDRVSGAYGHMKSEVKANLQVLVDEGVLKERDGRVRPHPDARNMDPERLFRSNLDRAADRREYAAEKGESVDNPDDKRD